MARLKTSLSQPEHQGHQDPKAQRENVLPPISGLAVVEQNACSHQESKEHQEGNERSNFCRSKKSVHFILRSCGHNRQTPANEGRMLRRHPKNQLQNTTLKAQDLSSITWEGRNKSQLNFVSLSTSFGFLWSSSDKELMCNNPFQCCLSTSSVL